MDTNFLLASSTLGAQGAQEGVLVSWVILRVGSVATGITLPAFPTTATEGRCVAPPD